MSGLLGQSLVAICAGVLLNLTPCVLPAIPLKIRGIIHAAGGTVRQRLLSGLFFVAGAVGLFLFLGGALAVFRLQWGFLFQSRGFLLLLVVLMALAGVGTLFGVSPELPQWVYRIKGHRYFDPLLSGALAAVLSTPCTGPFLGGVLVYGLTQPPAVVIWLFFLIGFGLALPYLLLLVFPRLMEKFPHSGPWSVRMRELLGFLLLAGSIFFAHSLVPITWVRNAWILWALGLGLWAAWAWRQAQSWPGRLLPAILALAAGVMVTLALGSDTRAALPWRPLDSAALSGLQTSGPVLIEFTAEWCINCKVLEQTVYSAPEVLQAAEEEGITAYRVDLTEPDQALEALLAGYGGAGLPFAVVLDRKAEVVQRLPDLFGAEALVEAMRRAGKDH